MGIAESRKVARELALLTVYCSKVKEKLRAKDCEQEVLSLLDEEDLQITKIDEETRDFYKRLIEAHEEHKDRALELIGQHLERWEIERMNPLDLSILELGVCELLGIDDVTYKVTISEAVNLAKKFSSNRAPLLVNAVMDSIAKTLGLSQ
uniref:Transcription antitermination protein NusB n=1 Tax=candidate division WOR-3 bacterium TaxID=2052148 RepID=A0A7C2P1M6_UNCW3